MKIYIFNSCYKLYTIIFIIDVLYSQLNNSLVWNAGVCTLPMASTQPMCQFAGFVIHCARGMLTPQAH